MGVWGPAPEPTILKMMRGNRGKGRITLHEPISNHLPEFKSVRVETSPGAFSAPTRPIQVRDLFSHTSGVFPTPSRAEIFELPNLQSFMHELAAKQLRAGYSSLLAIRFLFGIGEAGAFPNAGKTISMWFPVHERGRAQGIFFAGCSRRSRWASPRVV